MADLTGIVNESLIKHATPADLIARGLVEVNDGSGSQWGVSWDLDTTNFHLTINCLFVVNLSRRNPDSDGIKIIVEDLMDLDGLLSWIAD